MWRMVIEIVIASMWIYKADQKKETKGLRESQDLIKE